MSQVHLVIEHSGEWTETNVVSVHSTSAAAYAKIDELKERWERQKLWTKILDTRLTVRSMRVEE